MTGDQEDRGGADLRAGLSSSQKPALDPRRVWLCKESMGPVLPEGGGSTPLEALAGDVSQTCSVPGLSSPGSHGPSVGGPCALELL